MEAKKNDRHLDIPSEANRDKRVNFLAQERGETDPSVDESRREKEREKDGDKIKHNEDINENAREAWDTEGKPGDPKPIKRIDIEIGK